MSGSDELTAELMVVTLWLLKYGDVPLAQAQYAGLLGYVFDMISATTVLAPISKGLVIGTPTMTYHITDKAKQILAGEPNG